MAQTTHTLSTSMGDNNINSGNITGSFNNIVYKSDEDLQVMRWLSPLEPNNRHQDVRSDRFDGVGDWLLETSEFREWRSSEGVADKAVLFCSGNPGVGKTYLSSLVIDSLCDQAQSEDIAVAGLYFDFLTRQEQTTANMMGAILKQLVGRDGIPGSIREAFQKGKKEIGGRGPRLPDLMQMLRTALGLLPQVFICIDALDECLPKHLPELLMSLRDIVRESPKTRIFLTGRPHIKEDIQRYLTGAVVIPILPNRDDIRDYLESRLDGDADPEAMNDDLRRDIIRIILEKISDIFLLVSLNIDAILGEVTIRQRRKKLEEMAQGNGLSDAYTATLVRLKQQQGNKSILGQKVLMWVVYSERPLRTEELCCALGVEIGSSDLDPDNVPSVRTLVASCLGLITVEASSSTVRLVHFTLQEHLSSDPTLFHSPHSAIAEVCLTYLNFACIRDLSPTLWSAPPTTPLLEYASLYWGEHTGSGVTKNVKILALKLLDRFGEHISAQLLLLNDYQDSLLDTRFIMARGPRGFTGLHGVAFFGIMDIVPSLLEMTEWDVNATDCMGCTAIIWAARRGQGKVVKILLEREGVNPDQPDTRYGQTPLSWAAENGHEGIVKILLEREGVNPDHPDTEYGRRPLSWAAKNGNEGIVKILLEREGVNPDQPDTFCGRTPLSWAAEKGHEGIVKMLLEREGVNPDQLDTKYGRTPLSWAAENGNEGIVKILLEREGVNPDQPDTKYGRRPLSWAAKNGHEGIVKILLEREGVNPDQPGTKYGQTPLWWAANRGSEGIVKILLERESVNPDQPDTEYGQTPLSWAAENGHEGIVKILLEREGVNPDHPDTEYGRRPLSWAAKNGNEGIVKMLLEREGVNPDQPDTKYGRTPLSWAAENGNERIVKILLEREGVNPNQPDTKYGRRPLSWAAKNGNEGIVKILLEREGVNPDQPDTKYGRTPLSWAAENGHEGIVKILLEREGVNPDQPDTKYGRTPLSWAAGKGNEGIVKILLEREGVNPDQPDTKYGRRPLSWAAGYGYEGIVKILLEREGVNPDQPDTKYGRAPLSWAARGQGVVNILSNGNDVCAAALDNTNQNLLPLAPSPRLAGAVRALVERDNVNSDTAGRCGLPSPVPSTWHEGECAVEMHSRDDGSNTNITDPNGNRALPSVDLDERAAELHLQRSASNPPDTELSSAEPPRLPSPSSRWLLKLWNPPIKPDIHPNNTRSALSNTLNRSFIIASVVCLLAFLVHILPPSLLDLFHSTNNFRVRDSCTHDLC